MRLTVMRPAMMSSSIARRDPKPHEARILWSRCGSEKTSSVEDLCRRGGRLSAILCNARLGCCVGVGGEDRAREREWRFGGLCGGIWCLQEVGRIELGERRKLREGGEAEIVEERLGRRVERRSSRRLAMTDDLDPLPVLERLDDVRGYGHAADRFDIAAGNGLLVSDDGKRLHHRARIAWRLLGREPVEERLDLAATLEAPARRDL